MRIRRALLGAAVAALLVLAAVLQPSVGAGFTGSTEVRSVITSRTDFGVGPVFRWGMDTTPRLAPDQVGTASTWAQVSAGSQQSCAWAGTPVCGAGERAGRASWAWAAPPNTSTVRPG